MQSYKHSSSHHKAQENQSVLYWNSWIILSEYLTKW